MGIIRSLRIRMQIEREARVLEVGNGRFAILTLGDGELTLIVTDKKTPTGMVTIRLAPDELKWLGAAFVGDQR